MTLPPDDELEAAARWLCEQRGEAAEDTVFTIDDGGNDWTRRRWECVADDLRRHALMNEALRAVQENWFLNVKDFGAKGDGVSNDTAAIQAVANLAMSGNRPSGISLVYGESGEVVPLSERELQEVLERPRTEHRFVAAPVWRPISEAPRLTLLEIAAPDEARHFGIIDRGDGPDEAWINNPFVEKTPYPIAPLRDAVEQGWLWKEPTPLPGDG